MKIATWNVNSLRIRLEHVLNWSETVEPDLIALQETKVPDENFPEEQLRAAGWQTLHSGQPAYNGVAILSRSPLELVSSTLPGVDDTQKRFLAACIANTLVVNVYVPNGQSVGSDKYQYKLAWLDAFTAFMETQLGTFERTIILGDFNIAPTDQDVYDPAAWEGSVLVSPPERAAFRSLLSLGFTDSFRLFDQPTAIYSWWDYRQAAFRRNQGLRIDHILLSPPLAELCDSVYVDSGPRSWTRPSDHAPVVATIQV